MCDWKWEIIYVDEKQKWTQDTTLRDSRDHGKLTGRYKVQID